MNKKSYVWMLVFILVSIAFASTYIDDTDGEFQSGTMINVTSYNTTYMYLGQKPIGNEFNNSDLDWDDSLFAYYKLDYANGTDLQGNATLGFASAGIDSVAGQISNASYFTQASSEWIEGAANSWDVMDYTNNPSSISVWAYQNADSSVRTILSYGDSASTDNYFALQFDVNNDIDCATRDGVATTDYDVISNHTRSAGWYHIVCAHNGTDRNLYVNGVEAKTSEVLDAGASRVDWFDDDLEYPCIGVRCRTTSDIFYMEDKIDEVALYTRTLSATEIAELYEQQKGSYTKGKYVSRTFINDSANTYTVNYTCTNCANFTIEINSTGTETSCVPSCTGTGAENITYRAYFNTSTELYNVSIDYTAGAGGDTTPPVLTIVYPTNASSMNVSLYTGYLNYTTDENATLIINDSRWSQIDEYCYQESANVSNQTGIDGDCNLQYTGSYTNSSGFPAPPSPTTYDKSYDGNWSSYTGSLSTVYSIINYTKPLNEINSAIWQLKENSTSTINMTINESCLNAYSDTIMLRWYQLVSPPPSYIYNYSCHNGTQWINMKYLYNDSFKELWEEAVYWNIGKTSFDFINNTYVGIGNYSIEVNVTDIAGNSILSLHKFELVNDTLPSVDNETPTVTLINPTNASTDIDGSITFTANVSDNIFVQNVSLWINSTGVWHLNQTNISDGSSGLYNFDLTLENGTYIWNIEACDNASNCAFADANWTLTVNISTVVSENATAYNGTIPLDWSSDFDVDTTPGVLLLFFYLALIVVVFIIGMLLRIPILVFLSAIMLFFLGYILAIKLSILFGILIALVSIVLLIVGALML